MLAIRLPIEVENRLEHLDNLEDLHLAEQRLIDHRAGKTHHTARRSSETLWHGKLNIPMEKQGDSRGVGED